MLYVTYVLLFEKENMHRFKRIYLLGSLVFSMTVPFATLPVNVPQMPDNIFSFYSGWDKVIKTEALQPVIAEMSVKTEETQQTASVNYFLMLLSVYVLVTSLLLFRLLRNCLQMLARGRKYACMDYRDARIALMEEKFAPHSFGRYIFINREDYENGRIADEIIAHEWAHVRQRHTWDIVFIELLMAFGWFNPVFYLYRSKIRQNHEFLADDAVICRNRKLIPAYQTVLIDFIPNHINKCFTSNFNFKFLFTQKRIVMMTKTTSKKRAWCKSIALIPVLIAASFAFSSKTVAQNDPKLPEQTNGNVVNPVTDDERMITYKMELSVEPVVLNDLKTFPEQTTQSVDILIVENNQITTSERKLLPESIVQNDMITHTEQTAVSDKNPNEPIKATGECTSADSTKILVKYPVRLYAAKDGEDAPLFKQVVAMRRGNRYRFTICTDENSTEKAVLKLYDNKTELLRGSTYNPETDTMSHSFDFDCDKTTVYRIEITFKDGKEGTATGIVSWVENLYN